MNSNIWIALAHVKSRVGFENALNGRPGAYLNIVGKAHGIQELKKIAKKIFFDEGFMLIEELEDIELLSDRLKRTSVDKEIVDLVNELNETYPIQFATFHTYPDEDQTEIDSQTTRH
jgi:hypothetical protein